MGLHIHSAGSSWLLPSLMEKCFLEFLITFVPLEVTKGLKQLSDCEHCNSLVSLVELGENVTAMCAPTVWYYSSSGSRKHCLTREHPFRPYENARKKGKKEYFVNGRWRSSAHACNTHPHLHSLLFCLMHWSWKCVQDSALREKLPDQRENTSSKNTTFHVFPLLFKWIMIASQH